MKLKTKIFIRSVILSVLLIALIMLVHRAYVLHFNRQLMEKHYFQEVAVRVTEVDRLILWDDRLALMGLLELITEADDCVAYAFIEQGGQPYIYTFPDGIPLRLLGRPASLIPEEWRYQNENGMQFTDIFTQVGNASAVLHIGLSVDEMDEEMAPLLMRIAKVGVVTILLAILISAYVARWTTREFTGATAALRESEEKNRNLINNVPGMIYTANSDWSASIVSGSVEICGYTKQELNSMKEKWLSIVHPDDKKAILEKGKNLIYKKHGSIVDNYRIIHKEGHVLWVEDRKIPLFSSKGKFLGMDGILIDITERKRAEEALIESEHRYQELFGSVMEGIGIVDENEIIIFANPAFASIFEENSINDMLGKNLLDYFDESQKNIITMENNKRKTGESSQYELELPTRDGNKKYIFVSITPRRNKNNEFVGAFGSILDITETRRLKDLEVRAQRLETAGKIAGQVAHDFNNLLAPLVAYPEFIRDELPENHPALVFLDDIENSSRKIADINQQLLTLGRRGHYNQEMLYPNQLVERAIKELDSVPDALNIKTDLDVNLMNIMGGGAQIHRVLMNLLTNARDAMQDNGRLHIKTENCRIDRPISGYSTIPPGEFVKISISDTGCGIPDYDFHNIFDPFVTSKSSDQKRGSGLGLSVVDSVVKDHGGFIDLHSAIGQGTTFDMYFPVVQDVKEVDEEGKVVGGSEKILVVDDDEIQRQVTSHLLRKMGYQVMLAENGTQAIELARDYSFDLIMLDMMMPPGIDGVETFNRIRETRQDQKAIIVSGFSESERVAEAKMIGIGAFVKKPLTKQILITAVRKELDRKSEPVT
ncbi:MAG: PAS domain S-box protein [Candidatus Zixiibacteriota bacterium]